MQITTTDFLTVDRRSGCFLYMVLYMVKSRFLKSEKRGFVVVPRTGFEPVTYGLEIDCITERIYMNLLLC